MSKAYYCDHCEKMISEDNCRKVEMKLHRDNRYEPEESNLDLCIDCFQQLDNWIFGKLNVEEEKGA